MKPKIKLIILTLLLYGLPIYILSIFPFAERLYPDYESFQSTIFNFLFHGTIVISPLGIIFDLILLYCVFILLFKKNIEIEKERVYLIYSGIKKILSFVLINKLKKETSISKEEKVSLLFYMVKIFWAPMMVMVTMRNCQALFNLYHKYTIWNFDRPSLLNLYFPLYMAAIIILDTTIFSFGYLFESPKLKNVVKSVEPTALGWIFAILCYGPTLDLSIKLFGPLPPDFSNFGNINLNILTGLLSLILFSIYVWASVALGFKASNLTNRGIVSKGPYKYVRHPAYSSKNLSWWLMTIPLIKIFGICAIINMAVWSFIYFMRALTEERHLSADPDYIDYMKKVKYMFIPGVF